MPLYLSITYLVGVGVAIVVLLPRAEHKWLMGLFLVWLLGSPALNQPEFVPRVGALNFDLQPTRLMLLILLPALILDRLSSRRQFLPFAWYEKILLAYVALSVISILLNYAVLGITTAIAGVQMQIAFAVFYIAARDYLTERDRSVLLRALVLLALISAIVAIMQFAYDTTFFRVATHRTAFGDIPRSSGVFAQEYEHAMFVTFVAILVGLEKHDRPQWLWVCFAILGGVSVAVTFQRMPWAVFLLAVLGVFFVRNWNIPIRRDLAIVAGGIMLVLVLWVPWSEVLPRDFVTGRLLQDTLGIRLQLQEFGVSLLPKYPLGLGATFASRIYNREAYEFGLPISSSATGSIGTTIHNGFLSAAVRFGIGGGLAFGGMLFGYLATFTRRSMTKRPETFILPLIIAVLILYNLTEDFGAVESDVILLAAWLMGTFASPGLARLELGKAGLGKSDVITAAD